ncbi:MAG: glycosyltransferase [Bacteroidales bacterium]|nr:glycosyltransferase [Bacteroidales bacterium]
MPNPKLSIIIAMYNIEKYIAECLDSCRFQEMVSPDDYEVIIVNDGATDNSLSIALKSIDGASHMRIVNRENGGLSEARNTGLREAKGEYVWFVDGDDRITPDAVHTIIEETKATSLDAYIINFSTFEHKDVISTSDFKRSPTVLSGKEYHNQQLRLLPMMAWLTIYKTELLKANKLWFCPGILHEDKEFSVRAHHCCSSIDFIEAALYQYRVARTESIMNVTRKDNTKSLVSEIKILDSFEKFFYNEDNLFTRRIFGMCATTFFIRRYDEAFQENDVTKELITNNKHRLYEMMWKSHEWKRQALLCFIICMPSFCLKSVLPKIGNRSKLM